MANAVYHLTDGGPKRCSATKGKCPFASSSEHFNSLADARGAYEKTMETRLFPKVKPAKPIDSFSMDSYYGDWRPREIQLAALNGVRDALQEADQTQLIAACGTGKTYMGRQLMRHFMEQPGANGVAVVLTSSIKLAQDTANDLRAEGGYDKSLGEYEEDYIVVEVHSKVVMVDGGKSVKEDGAVSVKRIQEQIQEGIDSGKKVVIVSTYDSSRRVQEAQQLLRDPKKGEADILMHDEAHNILGQQTPTSITEAENTAYVGFANEIPGAIQARKRLYATATPVVEESGDKVSTGDLENALEVAERMKKNPKERITFYSTDSAIVGKVGGAITQLEAIDHDALAKPVYELREATVRGSLKGLKEPRVGTDGVAYEATGAEQELTPQTYSAVVATLNAMTDDPEPGVNPAHNALAYAGSIDQAKAFKSAFAAVALHESGGLSLSEAEQEQHSEDASLRRRARLRLLAEHADVKAAHSKSDTESRQEREAAFLMFKGNDYTEEEAAKGWSPHKRVLANVDIFSEGVNINEIDTVVISDDAKTSERAMTQGIGRAIRRVAKNPYKSTGHVIIPRALTEDGVAINDASVAAAAYGATRVERSIALQKLNDSPIKPDDKTEVTVYAASGEKKASVKAHSLGQRSLESVSDVVAAGVVNQAITELRKRPDWREISESEQNQRVISYLNESAKEKTAHRALVADHLKGKSHLEVQAIRRSSKILGSVLASGDVGALSPAVTSALIKHEVLKAGGATEEGPTIDEKRALLLANSEAITNAFASRPLKGNEEHEAIVATVRDVYPQIDKAWMKLKDRKPMDDERAVFEGLLSDSEFTDKLYSAVSTPEKREKYPRLRQVDRTDSLGSGLSTLELQAMNRSHAAASAGDAAYVANRAMLRKTGDLTARAIQSLANEL